MKDIQDMKGGISMPGPNPSPNLFLEEVKEILEEQKESGED